MNRQHKTKECFRFTSFCISIARSTE